MISMNLIRTGLLSTSRWLDNQTAKSQRQLLARSKAQGMTIVELMMVIFIGALIMAGAIGAFRYVERVRVQNTDRTLMNLDTAIEQYALDIGVYPQELDELLSGPTDPKLQRRWKGSPLVNESDLKDAWAQLFEYQLNPPGSDRKYELYSLTKSGEGHQYSPASK